SSPRCTGSCSPTPWRAKATRCSRPRRPPRHGPRRTRPRFRPVVSRHPRSCNGAATGGGRPTCITQPKYRHCRRLQPATRPHASCSVSGGCSTDAEETARPKENAVEHADHLFGPGWRREIDADRVVAHRSGGAAATRGRVTPRTRPRSLRVRTLVARQPRALGAGRARQRNRRTGSGAERGTPGRHGDAGAQDQTCRRVEQDPPATDLPGRRARVSVLPGVHRGNSAAGFDHGPVFLRHPRRRLERAPVGMDSSAETDHPHPDTAGARRNRSRRSIRAKGRVLGGIPAKPLGGVPRGISLGPRRRPASERRSRRCAGRPATGGARSAGGDGGTMMTTSAAIRVLMITSEWPVPDGRPRTTFFIKRQAEFLQAAGVDVDVFHFKGAGNPWNYVKAWVHARRRMAAGGYDLVHAQFGQSGLLALPKRLPLVVTFRGDDLQGIEDANGRLTLGGRLLKLASQAVASCANAAIVVSEHMRAFVHPSVRVHVIPSGLDLSLFRLIPQDEARRHLGATQGTRMVLFAGDPALARKRYSLARAAVDILNQSLPTELVVAWGAPHTEIPYFMNACDALVFTSMQEGSPNVVKEALACNLPVVSVPVGD